MFNKIFNLLIKLCSESVRFNEEKKLIKVIIKDINLAYRQDSFISSKDTQDNITNRCISKTLETDITLKNKKPQLKLEEVKVIAKKNKVIR